METIKIKAPATIANLVCGFDILGMALKEPFDIMELRRSSTKGVRIAHKDAFNLPTDPQQNIAGVVLLAALEKVNADFGVEMIIDKHIRPGSGLGSSAASAAGAAVAINKLLDNVFSPKELIELAMIGEALASGSRHADNIAPCVFGGITLIRSLKDMDIISLPIPDVFVTVVHPHIEIKTSDARKILKQNIALKDAICQWGNVAALVAGIMKNDAALIGRSLEDVLIEPARSILIPSFDEVKEKSILSGALGGGISGAGPSVFMLSQTLEIAERVGKSMREIYNRIGLPHEVYISGIASEGVSILS
ncbi:MAG TPA: homoserine kinase [Edaphocola sp.]|nr:homoserine kinase [Edaphocola sp.]